MRLVAANATVSPAARRSTDTRVATSNSHAITACTAATAAPASAAADAATAAAAAFNVVLLSAVYSSRISSCIVVVRPSIRLSLSLSLSLSLCLAPRTDRRTVCRCILHDVVCTDALPGPRCPLAGSWHLGFVTRRPPDDRSAACRNGVRLLRHSCRRCGGVSPLLALEPRCRIRVSPLFALRPGP
jgi:hypothetical protein